jgi:type IX secretion system PorP/SprF family membrane protein
LKKKNKILFILIAICGNLFAQDPQFSQFYSANLYLSPSFAGSTAGGRAAIVYRNQWPGIEYQFNTYNVAVDYYFPKYHSGLGFYMLRDAAGAGRLVSTIYQLQYSYLFRITNVIHCKPGIQVGYVTRSIDFNSLLFGDQLSFEGNKPVTGEKLRTDPIHLFDYAASLMVYAGTFWTGFTVDHLPFPNQSLLGAENETPLKISVFGGARIVSRQRLLLKDQDYISASFLYKKQGPFQQFDVGVYYDRYPIELGIWYRGLPILKNPYAAVNQDALVTKIGVFYENIIFGYSYDFTLSPFRSYSGGAHEVSIIVLFRQYQKDKKRFGAIPCPKL